MISMNTLGKRLLQRSALLHGAVRSSHRRAATIRAPLSLASPSTTPTLQSPALATRCFSSTDSSSTTSYNPLDWWKSRQTKKEQEKFVERTQYMANLKKWTLGEMQQELADSLDWKSKIPGVSSTKEVKDAKAIQGLVSALIEVVGENGTDSDIDKLKKLDKLRAANKAGKTLQEMNQFFDQFGIMCLMQRVLHQRKKEGRPLPLNQESLQMVLQSEGPRFMTKTQKDKMEKTVRKKYTGLGRQ